MPKKPMLNIARLSKFVLKPQHVRKPWSRNVIVDSTYRVVIAVLGRQPFYKKLDKNARKTLRELLLELQEAEHKLQSSESDLANQFSQGKISRAGFHKKLNKSPASFRRHMVVEEIGDFCKKNNVSKIVFDKFIDKVNRTINEIMQRFPLG